MRGEVDPQVFLAGANSIFYGGTVVLTTGNPDVAHDKKLLTRLGIKPEAPVHQ